MLKDKLNGFKELFGNRLHEDLTGKNPDNDDDFSEKEDVTEGFQEVKPIDKRIIRSFDVKDSTGKAILTMTEYSLSINEEYKRTVIVCEYIKGDTYLTEVEKNIYFDGRKKITGFEHKGKTMKVDDLEAALVA